MLANTRRQQGTALTNLLKWMFIMWSYNKIKRRISDRRKLSKETIRSDLGLFRKRVKTGYFGGSQKGSFSCFQQKETIYKIKYSKQLISSKKENRKSKKR